MNMSEIAQKRLNEVFNITDTDALFSAILQKNDEIKYKPLSKRLFFIGIFININK